MTEIEKSTRKPRSTKVEAEDRRNQILEASTTWHTANSVLAVLLAKAFEAKDHLALGYKTFHDYVAEIDTLGERQARKILNQGRLILELEERIQGFPARELVSARAAEELNTRKDDVIEALATEISQGADPRVAFQAARVNVRNVDPAPPAPSPTNLTKGTDSGSEELQGSIPSSPTVPATDPDMSKRPEDWGVAEWRQRASLCRAENRTLKMTLDQQAKEINRLEAANDSLNQQIAQAQTELSDARRRLSVDEPEYQAADVTVPPTGTVTAPSDNPW